MTVKTQSFSISTKSNTDIKDITGAVSDHVRKSGIKNGTVTVFIPGSTAGVTTIEFESGVLDDLSGMLERAAPTNINYKHDMRWGDGNGYAHVRSALVGASLTIPFSDASLILGTWQQITLLDFDNRPRKREVVLQIMGE